MDLVLEAGIPGDLERALPPRRQAILPPQPRAPYLNPEAQWRPADASPSGLAIAGNTAYLAALRGQRLWEIPLSGERAGTPRATLVGWLGRLRTVERAPDGTLWLTTSNRDGRGQPCPGDDRVLRLTGRLW